MNFVVHIGDVLEELRELPDESVQCCVTSPPYWGLRDYGHEGQIGLEKTPELYVQKMVEVFREVKRVLRDDGVLWLNLGDSYASDTKGSGGPSEKQTSNAGSFYNANQRLTHGLKQKDLVGIPWRVAFALQADGWWLRQDIIWAKPNPMPESVTDRCTKSHEYIFLLTKSARYYYDADAVRLPFSESYANDDRHGATELKHEPQKDYRGQGKQVQTPTQLHDNMFTKPKLSGANLKSVWTITTKPYSGAHFATFPTEIPEICIKAGSKKGDTILDPFTGSGTTGEVALRLERNFIGIELNEKYAKELAIPRLESVCPLFASTNG